MCMNLQDYKLDIQRYCKKNKLNYDKAMTMIKGCGNDSITFQAARMGKNARGLLDETPLPTVLILRKRNGEVEFEQTQYTQEYLSN